MKITTIISVFLTLFTIALQGQTVKVLDKSDLQPVSEVNISNAAKTLMVTTNNQGVADLSGFATGDSLFFSLVAF